MINAVISICFNKGCFCSTSFLPRCWNRSSDPCSTDAITKTMISEMTTPAIKPPVPPWPSSTISSRKNGSGSESSSAIIMFGRYFFTLVNLMKLLSNNTWRSILCPHPGKFDADSTRFNTDKVFSRPSPHEFRHKLYLNIFNCG